MPQVLNVYKTLLINMLRHIPETIQQLQYEPVWLKCDLTVTRLWRKSSELGKWNDRVRPLFTPFNLLDPAKKPAWRLNLKMSQPPPRGERALAKP